MQRLRLRPARPLRDFMTIQWLFCRRDTIHACQPMGNQLVKVTVTSFAIGLIYVHRASTAMRSAIVNTSSSVRE